ncbi:MAG: hydroxyethylthiazole kinase [Desulfatiglandales bacterium]
MFDQGLAEKAGETLHRVRERRPLVHCITNYVTMNYTANALLAVGASPVMAHAEEEVEEMVALAQALVLNLGTLTQARVEAMAKAGREANKRRLPIVLDPVGAGATTLRSRSARKLMEDLSIQVIRGNPSEILSLCRGEAKPKGVETMHTVDESAQAALKLAQDYHAILAVSGPVDLVTDGRRVYKVHNGHPMMGYMTGAGCTATAVIASFLAAGSETHQAAAAALSCLGLAAETAAKASNGPGTFQIRLLDALYHMREGDLKQGARIEIARGAELISDQNR